MRVSAAFGEVAGVDGAVLQVHRAKQLRGAVAFSPLRRVETALPGTRSGWCWDYRLWCPERLAVWRRPGIFVGCLDAALLQGDESWNSNWQR
jgi:hypothetical protein